MHLPTRFFLHPNEKKHWSQGLLSREFSKLIVDGVLFDLNSSHVQGVHFYLDLVWFYSDINLYKIDINREIKRLFPLSL